MSVYRSRVASSRGACAHRAFRIHHGTPGVNEWFAVSQGQMHKSPAHGGVPAILLSRLCAGALPDTGRTQEKTAHPPLRSFPICKSAQHFWCRCSSMGTHSAPAAPQRMSTAPSICSGCIVSCAARPRTRRRPAAQNTRTRRRSAPAVSALSGPARCPGGTRRKHGI